MPTLEETLRDKIGGLEDDKSDLEAGIAKLEADNKALRERIKGFETAIENIYQETRNVR